VPQAEPLFERQPEAARAPEPQAYEPPSAQPGTDEDDALELTTPEALDLDDEEDDWGDEGDAETAEEADAAFAASGPLDLGAEDEEDQGAGGQDELLLDASRLAEADEPVASPLVTRKRPLVSGDSMGGGGALGGGDGGAPKAMPGNTLFERMANLSRGRAAAGSDEDEGEGDSGSISIPRFLGRQNNQ
jgi:cell division protein FtsZ